MTRMITPEELVTMRRVTRFINAKMTYESDQEHYGMSEYWKGNPPDWKGDCEDYALTKMTYLVRLGFKKSRLSIYVVECTRFPYVGQYHAVLLVDDIWVLDNLIDEVVSYNSTGYRTERIIRPK